MGKFLRIWVAPELDAPIDARLGAPTSSIARNTPSRPGEPRGRGPASREGVEQPQRSSEIFAVLEQYGHQRVQTARDAEVLIVGAGAADAANTAGCTSGAGIVVVAAGPDDGPLPAAWPVAIAANRVAPHEGLLAAEAPVRGAGLLPGQDVDQVVLSEDLLARVTPDSLHATATLHLEPGATALLRLPGTTRDPGAVTAAAFALDRHRVVVLGVALDEGSGELLRNAVSYAGPRANTGKADRAAITVHPGWLAIRTAVEQLRVLQVADGSIPDDGDRATSLVHTIVDGIESIAPRFPHDADYLAATVKDLLRWADAGFGVPDFLDSLLAFHPQRDRIDGRQHLVLFPMYTQNGNANRNVEAVLLEVIWPEFIADLEAGEYSNPMFVPIRFLDFTAGYDTNSAVLFPETIAMREVPAFSWGAIFADREAARFRSVVTAAAGITRLALPPDAARLLADQRLAEETFVLWDLIHDRTHMHGDLPFDPFMIKQRMPFFLYTLEELRCDLTAYREAVALERDGVPHARLVQYAVLFDRIFRFAISGGRVRNYDGLGGQLLFAWLHQHRVLHWTDNRLTIEWDAITEPVLELGRQIEHLYWQSIDRSKTAHWLAAYALVSSTVAPHPASVWAKGPDALPLDGPPRLLTDAVLPDEFPLSMFYEALNRKLSPVIAATSGITG